MSTPSIVQSLWSPGPTTTGVTTTAGNAFLVVLSQDGATSPLSAPTDNKGNSYGSDLFGGAIYNIGPYEYGLAAFIVTDGAGGSGHTWTNTNAVPPDGSDYQRIAVFELAGVDNASPVSAAGTVRTTSSGTSVASNAITPADLSLVLDLIAYDWMSATDTYLTGAGTGYAIELDSHAHPGLGIAVTYKSQTAIGSESPTATIPNLYYGLSALLAIKGAAATGTAGSAALTDGADALSASGTVPVAGSAALTDVADAISASGTVPATGSAALTDSSDSLSAGAGVLVDNGTAVLTDAGDSLSAAGSVAVSGSASLTDAGDTVTASGTVATPAAWTIQEFLQATQKWTDGGAWTPGTISVTVADGEGLIVAVQCWNDNPNGEYVPSISPGSLQTLHDPSATITGTAEPVFCQLFCALNLAAGTYVLTPPNLGYAGDGDMYVARVSGIQSVRLDSLGTERTVVAAPGHITSTTSTLGASAQAGDLVIGIGGTDNDTLVTTLTVNTPAGWTNLGKQTDGTNSPVSSFDYKAAAGGSESATWTWADEASPVGDSALIAFSTEPAGAIVGSFVGTDAADSLVGSGTVSISGAGALVDSSDAITGAATVSIGGYATLADSGGSLDAAATVGIRAAAALTDSGDSLSAYSAAPVTGGIVHSVRLSPETRTVVLSPEIRTVAIEAIT